MKLAKRAKLTRPDDIGKAPHHYAMARKGDAGDYEVGNCRFITVEQNTWEKTVNGGSYVAAEKLRGRTKENDPSVARSAEKLRGRTKSTHVGYQIVSEARSKPFAVLSPRGKKYVGRNVKEFAAKHGLNQSELSKVFRGAVAHHKGWTGYYTD
jgi:hypothetical protein